MSSGLLGCTFDQWIVRDGTGVGCGATLDGPVFITDRGRPAHVLLSIEEYRRLTGRGRSIGEALSMPGMEDIEFDPPKFEGNSLRIPDFED